MTRTQSTLLVLAAFLTLAAPPARAIAVRSRAAGETGGLFLRFALGYGQGETAATLPDEGFGEAELKLSGSGFDFEATVGGFVAPDLALHGAVFAWVIDSPDVELGGQSGGMGADLSLSAITGGLTWYPTPTGFSLSGSAGFGELSVEDAETDMGLVLQAGAGMEWPVGERWALGLGGSLIWHRIGEAGLVEDWSGQALALRFTASRR